MTLPCGNILQKRGKLTALSILIFSLWVHSIFAVSVEKDLLLTEAEKNALIKFRQKVSPLLYRNFMKYNLYLVRWLRAKNFDIASAEAALRAHLKWRKQNKIDTILQEDWSDMKTDFYATTDTYDKEGRPIIAIDIGDWDVRSGILRGQGQRLKRYMEYLMEDATMQVFERQKKGLNVTQWVALDHAGDFNLIQHGCTICIPLWIQITQSMEANYYGWLDKIIIFNAPPLINVVLDATRPFMSQYSRDALKVLGPNRNRWMQYLDQYIAKDQRTRAFGGTKPTNSKTV